MDIWEGLQQLPFEAKAAIAIPTTVTAILWAITELRKRAKNADAGTNIHGSVIFSDRQMGGQIGHSIVNVGPQPRRLSDEAAKAISMRLQQLPAVEASIDAPMGDPESWRFATQLKDVLVAAGWSITGLYPAIYDPLPQGVVVRMPSRIPAVMEFIAALEQAGFQVRRHANPEHENVEITVGSSF